MNRKSNWKWAITSEDEWYKAAYHKNDGVTGDYFDYPTSSNSAPGRDMTEAANPGNNANYYDDSPPMPIDSPHYATMVGEFELSRSPYGTFDQGGNVWEWNESILLGSYRAQRGGAYNINHGYMGASYRYSGVAPTGGNDVIGFRVVQVPEPASLLLLAFGGLAVMRRRLGWRSASRGSPAWPERGRQHGSHPRLHAYGLSVAGRPASSGRFKPSSGHPQGLLE